MKISPLSLLKVYGESMLPTLKPAQYVITFNWFYLFNKPSINDLVVTEINNRLIIKRIHSISEDSVFLKGDNSSSSTDSKSFGLIPKSKLIGKVILII